MKPENLVVSPNSLLLLPEVFWYPPGLSSIQELFWWGFRILTLSQRARGPTQSWLPWHLWVPSSVLVLFCWFGSLVFALRQDLIWLRHESSPQIHLPDSTSQVICHQYVPPYWHLYFRLAISSFPWPSGHMICLSLDGHKLYIPSNVAWFPLEWFPIFLFLLISNITHFIYLANFLNVDFHFFEDLIAWEDRIQCHWGPLLHFLLWRLSVWCASMCTPLLQMNSGCPARWV